MTPYCIIVRKIILSCGSQISLELDTSGSELQKERSEAGATSVAGTALPVAGPYDFGLVRGPRCLWLGHTILGLLKPVF